MCQLAVMVNRISDAVVKSSIERLTMSYIIDDGVGMAAAARLKTFCLRVIICPRYITGVGMVFRQKKFYKMVSGKSIKRSFTVVAFLTNKVLSKFKQIS